MFISEREIFYAIIKRKRVQCNVVDEIIGILFDQNILYSLRKSIINTRNDYIKKR